MFQFLPRNLRGALEIGGLGLACTLGFSGSARSQDAEIRQVAARISYLSGDVSYSRGDDPDDWQSPAINVPFTLGDRLYSPENGRVELQIQGGEFLRLAARSDLAALNLTEDTKQFSLTSGTASVQLRRLDENETFEVDTPNVAVTFERPGDYRIDVDANGNTRVSCSQGEASVAAAGGEVPLRAGEQMWIDGIDNPQYDVGRLDARDSWDSWVASRESRFSRMTSSAYVNVNIGGIDDLEEYGRWEDVPAYGRCWTPSRVEFGWQPYRSGRWIWEDPWGWTWIGDEPWGWAPYHYGRWVVSSSRWYWVPVGPSVAVHYSPALVAFVGGGPGWSLSLAAGGSGYVGWFPLGPRDPFSPWWGSRARARVDVDNYQFANRSYVTVVNENTFVSGGVVAAGAVRDPQIVRQVASAPVIRGPIPVLPTVGSLRVSARGSAGAAVRPPVSIAARPVVTRVAPPPAPARFQEKLVAIRESRGAPISASAAAQLSITARGGARAVSPVRPVVVETGRTTFQPRNAQSAAPKAAPVTEHRGRPLATLRQPIVSAPAASPGAPGPARIAPGAVVTPRDAPLPPPEGTAPKALDRRVSPPPPPPAAPTDRRDEGWRTRQNPPPPPVEQAAPPPNPAPNRFERRTPPPPPVEQAAPPPQGRRIEQPGPPPPQAHPGPPERGDAKRAQPDKGQGKDQKKGKDNPKDKDNKDKNKKPKEEPPPPSAP